jgi:hypothetical protein
MRTTPLVALAATAALVAGCAETTSRQVSATPPTVAYQVVGNDMARANSDAGYHCSRYNMAAQLTGVQPSANGSIASYYCVPGTSGQTYGTTAPIYNPQPIYSSGAPVYGSTAPVYAAPGALGTSVECADFFHQSRPGGSNYEGPPVPGCPRQY